MAGGELTGATAEPNPVNRQWLLRRRPVGQLSLDDLTYVESSDWPALRDGQVRVRNLLLLCAPTMRNWMEAKGSGGYPSMPLGQPVGTLAAARVVESRAADVPVDSLLVAPSGWQDYAIIDPQSPGVQIIADDLTPAEAIGAFGLNSLTAYFGLLRVGRPTEGETLVVSGAAGATGSVVAQIGIIMGCHVIGIAGGSAKCGWLRDIGAVHDTIDYKAENVAERLSALCPKGIDIFYDNVGGDILQAAFENMAKRGRIVLCGQIAGYNVADTDAPGLRNLMRMIYRGIRMEGFLMTDYAQDIPAARAQLRAWADAGRLKTRLDIRSGFADIPMIFNSLFDGTNEGCLLVDISEE